MPSLISWLDSTPEEQRAARELVAMFSDKESRDELGIGPIRDAFSDLLFPGTSVLQTRARYYLFVPWCYLTPGVARLSGTAHRDGGRGNERALIKTFLASNESDKAGLIGGRVGVSVRNLPSDVYWNGMIRYGIREHRGALGSFALPKGASEGASEITTRAMTEWNRTIPPSPSGFPDAVEGGFALTFEEASWLRDRIVGATEGTLLAYLLEQGDPIDKDSPAPWFAAPEPQFEALHHARMFSLVMRGAALLYNLLIAERYERAGLQEEDEDTAGYYGELLAEWHDELLGTMGTALQGWDLDRMWQITKRSNPNIQRRAEEFVDRWVVGLRSGSSVADNAKLRALVEEREKRKGAQSRLKNEKMLAAWTGASGTGRLTYRWGTVKNIVNDIVGGLNDAGA